MTDEEKRRLAVQRELIELEKTVKAFDRVVEDAQRIAVDMIAAGERMKKVNDDARLAIAIDQLDYLSRRGSYRDPDTEPELKGSSFFGPQSQFKEHISKAAETVSNAYLLRDFFGPGKRVKSAGAGPTILPTDHAADCSCLDLMDCGRSFVRTDWECSCGARAEAEFQFFHGSP